MAQGSGWDQGCHLPLLTQACARSLPEPQGCAVPGKEHLVGPAEDYRAGSPPESSCAGICSRVPRALLPARPTHSQRGTRRPRLGEAPASRRGSQRMEESEAPCSRGSLMKRAKNGPGTQTKLRGA